MEEAVEVASSGSRPEEATQRRLNYLFLLLAVGLASASADAQQASGNGRLPDLTGTSEQPVEVRAGSPAFLSCQASNLQNYTLVWRYTGASAATSGEEQGRVLTAGLQRVTGDQRFSVLRSHDTWLLKISQVEPSDAGTYVCHTNSEPRVRAFRILSVLSTSGGQQGAAQLRENLFNGMDYDFGDCCRAEGLAPRCQRLCSLQQMAATYHTINLVHECYSSLPSISRCMLAGRNVTDCCQQRHLPHRCQPMCGAHTSDASAPITVQDHTYCADYSATILSCTADGLSKLPGQPELVVVEAVSADTLQVSWQKSQQEELHKVDGFIINLSKLSSFEDTLLASSASNGSSVWPPQAGQPLANLTIVDVNNNASLASMTKLLAANSATVSLKLDKQLSEFAINNLKPYTVYQIQMFAYNALGRSQLTDPIRALTLAPELAQQSAAGHAQPADGYEEPRLPDTRKCCLDAGVTLGRCLDTLCDPVQADKANLSDLMICAPWSNITFGCLSSRVDHSHCCMARGVTPFCQSICSGQVKRFDHRYFRCLAHMGSYTNCILESHNVLPSAPQNFTVAPITHGWAVLDWRAPRKHAPSVRGYRIFSRQVPPAPGPTQAPDEQSALGSGALIHQTADAATNPYLLDGLAPDTVYEVFVVAVNKFGESQPTPVFTFQTLADPDKLALEQLSSAAQAAATGVEARLPLHDKSQGRTQSYFNETACCLNSGLKQHCLQLCDYDVKVEDVGQLVGSCSSQMPVMLRCMAGSRNSVPCCRSRGVSDGCLNVCAGLSEHSPLVLATRCAKDFGKIITCMDESSRLIPSAPIDLRVTDIEAHRVSISWSAAPEDALRSDTQYHVRYQQLQQASEQPATAGGSPDLSSLIAVVPLHPLEHVIVNNTSNTQFTIDKLKAHSRYSIYVTAENSNGISLPSLVLLIQTPAEGESSSEEHLRKATLGAPHQVEILNVETDSLMLRWLAPLFVPSELQIRYRIFYKQISGFELAAGGPNTTSAPPTEPSAPVSTASSIDTANLQQSSNWTLLETPETTALLKNLHFSSQYAITVQAYSKNLLGHMSEILIASTAKPVPPALNQPLVIGPAIEGRNITIMCVALGRPTPQISMFINGLLVQKRTQPYVIYHLVNLVRGHLSINCFASNGRDKDYASVQSRTELNVSFPPKIKAQVAQVNVAGLGATPRLTCQLTGYPQPFVVWKRVDDSSTKSTVVLADHRISTLMVAQLDQPFTWHHTIIIANVTSQDLSSYICYAENDLGSSEDTVRLHLIDPPDSSNTTGNASSSSLDYLRQSDQTSDITECCKSENISPACMPACTSDGLDVDAAFSIPECQPHLDQLMMCAADGSDHRNCCRRRQVPLECWRWCSGSRLNLIAGRCFLASALDINQCFQENRNLLPGVPKNVRLVLASESSHADQESEQLDFSPWPPFMSSRIFPNNLPVIQRAAGASPDNVMSQDKSQPLILEWEPPVKNPQLAHYYKVFWRRGSTKELYRSLTNETWIKLNDLYREQSYEFVVKAANLHGSSVFSEPLTAKPIDIEDQSNMVAASKLMWFIPGSSGASSLVGRIMAAITVASLFMFGSLALVMLLERRGYLKRLTNLSLSGKNSANTSRVSFANPAYSKNDTSSDGTAVTWDSGHSLEVLGPPPTASTTSNSDLTN